MAVSKVVYGANVLMDLTSDTVTADKLLQGYTAHNAAGNIVNGAIDSKPDSGNTTLDGTTTAKSFAAGYYANAHSCSVSVYDGSVTDVV